MPKKARTLLFIAIYGFVLVGCGSGGGGDVVAPTPSITPTPSVTPSITILSPLAGQILAGNDTTEVTWTSEGTVGDLVVELSLDGGSSWTSLVTSTSNDGSETVSLPDTRSVSSTIRISDINGSVSDQSGVFSIWTNVLPEVQNIVVVGSNGDIDVNFDLIDADFDVLSVQIDYWNGVVWNSATVTGAVTGLTPPTSVSLIWNSLSDEAGSDMANYQIRVTPHDTEAGNAGTSPALSVDNNEPPVVSNVTISGTNGDVTVNYELADTEADLCSISVEYWTTASGWSACTVSGTTSSLSVGSRSIVWRSMQDEEGKLNSGYRIRVTPSDNDEGTVGVSAYFALDNRFTKMGFSLLGLRNGDIAWGDYDNDGDLDLAGCGWSTGDKARIFRNDGGSFAEINAGLAGAFYCALAWGDYDGDGDLDLAVAGNRSSGGSMSRIYRNDGGTFTNISAGLTPVGYAALAWGDYDNDGDLDLALAGNSSGGTITSIFRNDGGVFTDINAGLIGIYFGELAWGDYDNDGDLDLALTGSTSPGRTSRIYRNDDGLFTDIDAGLTGVSSSSVAWGDYDNDGDLDLALAGSLGTGRFTRIYRNDGGTFSNINAGLIGLQSCDLAWGDYDNDGDLDLAVTGSTNSDYLARIYQNDGGTFTDTGVDLIDVYGHVAWGDYDSDGDLDLAIAGETSSNSLLFKIYRNNLTSPNSIPVQPSNLQTLVSGASEPYDVSFSWDSGSDVETPVLGLSYQLRVGTTAGGNDVRAGQHLPDGKRLFPQFGATAPSGSSSSSQTLHLSAGTYYWTVQTIDGSLEGSSVLNTAIVNVP